uniref:Transmembrane protein n=1 Tax=Marseillevirus LCMAC202 TaxID=2506606 RepID=A0A481YY04_9VIRU|nr:MAG: hypothetical protein LCMAC202_04950 [Marseillevirus LCMAC202]
MDESEDCSPCWLLCIAAIITSLVMVVRAPGTEFSHLILLVYGIIIFTACCICSIFGCGKLYQVISKNSTFKELVISNKKEVILSIPDYKDLCKVTTPQEEYILEMGIIPNLDV